LTKPEEKLLLSGRYTVVWSNVPIHIFFLAENTAGEAPIAEIILNKNKDCTKKPQKRGKKNTKKQTQDKKTILRPLYTTGILGAFAH